MTEDGGLCLLETLSLLLSVFQLDRMEIAPSHEPTSVFTGVNGRTRLRKRVCVLVREKLCFACYFYSALPRQTAPLMSNDWAPLHSSFYGYQPGSVYARTHCNFDLQWSTVRRARAPESHLLTHPHVSAHTHTGILSHTQAIMLALYDEKYFHT